MSMQIAARVNALSPTELIVQKDLPAARLISDVLCPPVVATISIAVSAAHLATPSAWEAAALFLVLAVGIPTLYIVWLLYRGEVTDFHLRVREQRIKPMIVIVTTTVSAWLLLFARQAPALLVGVATVGLTITVILLLVTLRWKISGHTTAISGFVVLCWWLAGASVAPLALSVPLVAWSRIQLLRHTLAQTIAGAVLGFTISWAFTAIR